MPPSKARPVSRHTHGRSEVKQRPEMIAALREESMKLAARLKQVRRALAISQETAADRIGVHPVQLARMERGATNVTLATLVAAARAYNVPLRDLFHDEPVPAPQNGTSGAVPTT